MSALLLLVACGEPAATPEPPAPAPVAAPTPAAPAPAAPPADGKRVAKVLETMDGGGYTYARMDACGAEAWVAGPQTALKVGQTVEMPMGTTMTNFAAKSLGRTFDAILFVNSIAVVEGEPQCAPPAPPGSPGHGQGGEVGANDVKRILGVVKSTMKSGGYTYAEVDTCGKVGWIAGPPVPLQSGDVAAFTEGAMMANFESKTLGRTFESIRFVDQIAVSPTPPKCD